jgi:hypothetical protein
MAKIIGFEVHDCRPSKSEDVGQCRQAAAMSKEKFTAKPFTIQLTTIGKLNGKKT